MTSTDQVVFHVWKFPGQELREYPATAIKAHVPKDQGHGLWKDLKITLKP